LLSFETNRILFERINSFAVRRGFRASLGMWGRYSRFDLRPELMANYQNECVDRILSILSQGDKSPLLREDPNGTSALMQVKTQRRDERWVTKDSVLLNRRRFETAAGWLPCTPVPPSEPIPQPQFAPDAQSA
jgi:hypothetical protein